MGSSWALGGLDAWKKDGIQQGKEKAAGLDRAIQARMGLTPQAPAAGYGADPWQAPVHIPQPGGLFSPQNVQQAWKQQGEQAFGEQVWKTMTGQAPARPAQPQARPSAAPPSPPAPAQPAPVAVGQTPAQAVPAQTTSDTGAVAKAPPQQPPALEFGYKPNLSGMGGASLDQLSDQDFEMQRRQAFLSGKDSLAGMRQVRELLAQRNGYSANEARTMSVAGLEKPKAGSTQGGGVPSWNLTGGQGEAVQGGYGTVGEKNLDQVMDYLQQGGPVAAVKAQEWEAMPSFGGAMAADDGSLRAQSDLNTNPLAPSTQALAAAKHGATIDAPGGAVTEEQSSADGQISGQSPDLNQGGMLQAPSYSEAGVMAPGGADFRALANDWAQSGSGLRGRLENTPLDQVAPWQMRQAPLTLNGDNTRDARMAAFAAAGENDPSRSMTEALAASPFGSRDGQSMSGATTDLSQLDARQIYGQKDRPTQVRSGVPGFNPGNY